MDDVEIKIDAGYCGEEWAGTYVVSVLYAPFSLRVFSKVREYVKEHKIDPSEENTISDLISWTIMRESVRKDGELLPEKIPHRLYMRLFPLVSELNDVSLEERREHFLQSTAEKPTE